MEYYPLYMSLKGKACLVVGGGDVAKRKARGLIKAGANVTILAPEIDTSIKKVSKVIKEFEPSDLNGFFLVISATSDHKTNKLVQESAKERGILVNVVDNKFLSDFILPSIVDQDPLLISISTSGISPYLSKKLKEKIISAIGDDYSRLLKIASDYRDRISSIKNAKLKKQVIEKIFSGEMLSIKDKHILRKKIEEIIYG